ncbi:EAL domain-containing protein [Alishewanella sp. SMS9]|nr:EAL domain-containing protein [Alishewanella sp. SMS9]
MTALLQKVFNRVSHANIFAIPAIIALIILICSPFVSRLIPGISDINYLPLHSILEIISVSFAFMIFAVSAERILISMNIRTAILACAFLAVVCFDLSHLLSFTGMPDYVTPSGPQKTIYFWLAARFTAAVALFLVVLPLANRPIKRAVFVSMLVITVAIIALVHMVIFYHANALPTVYVPQQGLTLTKIAAEYLFISLNILTILWMRFGYAQNTHYYAPALYTAMWCLVCSGFYFTLYLDMHDAYNAVGHVFKIAAYLFLYRALLHEVLSKPYLTLIEREADISATLAAIPDVLFEVDDEERFCQVKNTDKVSMYLPPEHFLGKTLVQCMPKEAYIAGQKAIAQARQSGRSEPCSYPLLIEGKVFWFQVIAARRQAKSNKPRFVLAVRDITQQMLAEAELKVNALALYTREGIMITDANNHIIKVNPAFSFITGYEAHEVVGKSPSILSSGQHDAAFYKKMWLALSENGLWQGEIYNKRKNGEIFPEQVVINALTDQQGTVTHYIASFNDISKAKADQQYIHQLAFYDPLTKLPNRRLLIERTAQAQTHSDRSGHYAALFFIDLDHFKQLNDSLGHSYGDELLRQLSERLQHAIREQDTLARPGGDEFILLAQFNSSELTIATEDAHQLGHKLLEIINNPFELKQHHYQISASIGIALFNDNKKNIDDLMSSADLAMYHSKEMGRNQLYFFEPGMHKTLRKKQRLEQSLKQAISKQQLKLFYQPKVNSQGQIVSYEALIRWFHPEFGLITPNDFIPLAENSYLINEIGEWVLTTACQQIRVFQQQGTPLPIAVNVSERQLVQKNFVEIVSSIVQNSGIDPHLLELEITESMLNEDLENTRIKLLALSKLGITFSLDDFGTGYSSLIYLKNLPINVLKIDRSFVHEFLTQETDLAIVKTIIAMAKSLSLHVVAEGVEQQDQYEMLMSLGCDLFQGYLFGKPEPLTPPEPIE